MLAQTMNASDIVNLFKVSYVLAGFMYEEFIYNADLTDRLEALSDSNARDLQIRPEEYSV